MNSLPLDVKVIYITPFLSETERIARECPKRKFKQPSVGSGKSKSVDFIKLIEAGENISSTHVLFKGIGRKVVKLLKEMNYILVLDEVMNVVEKLDIYDDENLKSSEKEDLTKKDVDILLSKGMMYVDEGGLVKWKESEDVLHKYEYLKELADRKMLYYLGADFLIWTFPIEVFMEGIFKEIYILTYQFESQIQSYYYDYFNLKYEKYRVFDRR